MKQELTDLDDYYRVIQDLIEEINRYAQESDTLSHISESLKRVLQQSTAASKSIDFFANETYALLQSISDEITQMLILIRGLKLDELQAETQARYEAHQSRLDQLGKDIEDAVREQQRQGLEMLQHTTALQGELGRYATQVEQTSRTLGERQSLTDARLQTLSAKADAAETQLQSTDARVVEMNDQLTLIRKLIFINIAILIIIAIVSTTI